jgi:hypothetical protein
VRQQGSHKQFAHPDGRFTTVPFIKVEISRRRVTFGARITRTTGRGSLGNVRPLKQAVGLAEDLVQTVEHPGEFLV